MTDFNPILLRMLAQKPDIISVNASPAGSVGLIIKQARELGFKGRFIHIGQVDTSVVANIAGKANVEGMWVHGYVQTPLPETLKSWQARYTKKYGEWNATSIDFANPAFAFVAAVKKAQSLDAEEDRRGPADRGVRQPLGQGALRRQGLLRHRQPDHLRRCRSPR